jgi:hypothetical protein
MAGDRNSGQVRVGKPKFHTILGATISVNNELQEWLTDVWLSTTRQQAQRTKPLLIILGVESTLTTQELKQLEKI